MKFTSYEANGIHGFVSNSPLLSWMYSFLSIQGFSNFLGVLEISVGLLIAARVFSPKLAILGGVLSTGLFFTTLSFMLTTPGVFEASLGFPAISVVPGQFLLKDLGLFVVSIRSEEHTSELQSHRYITYSTGAQKQISLTRNNYKLDGS